MRVLEWLAPPYEQVFSEEERWRTCEWCNVEIVENDLVVIQAYVYLKTGRRFLSFWHRKPCWDLEQKERIKA